MPRTEIILERDWLDWLGLSDGRRLSEGDIKILKESAGRIGYPLFMRNDFTSGKHRYVETCYVLDEESLLPHLYVVIEDALIRDAPVTSIVLREYIELDSKFKAFKGFPVAPERRYFVRQGKVTCRHPYWVQDSIEFWGGTPEPDNWESLLSEMNTETVDEITLLTGYAEKIAAVLEGSWSLDFAKSRSGLWYFIDAAEYEKSWHPDCPNNLNPDKEKRRRDKKKSASRPIKLDDFI
jgi:hypothetical protein